MTLGGLALAVGILVDDATVTIENIERHMHLGSDLHKAILEGAGRDRRSRPGLHPVHLHRVRADVLSHRRCALSVRAAGGGRGVRDAGVLRAVAHAGADAGDAADGSCPGGAERPAQPAAARIPRLQRPLREDSRAAIRVILAEVARAAPAVRGRRSSAFACCPAVWCSFWGATSFPSVDGGQIRLHMRLPTGTRIEETARVADEVEGVIRTIVPAARSRHRARQSGRGGQRHQQIL